MTSWPQMDRQAGVRKRWIRDHKDARILARQVARAARIPDQAPPLIRNGKAAR